MVVVVGSVHMDLVATADRLPARGETLPGWALGIHPGGKGGNQAVQVALAGARSVMLGRVGRDDFGFRLRAALEEKGVVLDWLSDDDRHPTGASTVLVGQDGDYCSIIVPGASLALTPDRVADARTAFETATAVVAQLELPVETVAAALTLGQEAGALTILNAAPAPENPRVLDGLLSLVDVLVVNEVEAAMLAGRKPETGGGIDEVLAELASSFGIRRLVVTLGSRGAVVIDDSRREWLEGHRVEVVDAVGAGDAFVGTLAASLAHGATFETAARRANTAGALAVTRAGAYDALPTASEVDRFLGRLPTVPD